MQRLLSFFLIILITGCSSNMKPIDFKDQKPRLIIEEYLSENVKLGECFKIGLVKLLGSLKQI